MRGHFACWGMSCLLVRARGSLAPPLKVADAVFAVTKKAANSFESAAFGPAFGILNGGQWRVTRTGRWQSFDWLVGSTTKLYFEE